jgi:caffeoyl-CoA O-methyltransferase
MTFIDEAVDEYVFEHTQPAPELLERLEEYTRENTSNPDMLTGRVEGRFLKLIVKITGVKKVLELGLFTGYSALSMAEALPEDGRLVSLERDPEAKAIAEEHIAQSPHGKKIEIKFGEAMETIMDLDFTPDLVFLDADKDRYPEYYEIIVDMLEPGGLILIDNSLWDGDVVDPETESAKAIDAMNQMIMADDRVENVLLTVRDGIQLVRKK